MNAPLRLQPRERRLAIVAGVCVGCWGLVSLVVQPLWDGVRDLHAQVASQTERLEAVSRLLAQADAIEQRYRALAAVTTSSTEADPTAFLSTLEALSRQADIQLTLKPRPLARKERTLRFEIELDVEGPQPHLLAFLDRLFSLPQLIAVERLRLASLPAKKDPTIRATLLIQRVSLEP
jgi:hypothetical protein